MNSSIDYSPDFPSLYQEINSARIFGNGNKADEIVEEAKEAFNNKLRI